MLATNLEDLSLIPTTHMAREEQALQNPLSLSYT